MKTCGLFMINGGSTPVQCQILQSPCSRVMTQIVLNIISYTSISTVLQHAWLFLTRNTIIFSVSMSSFFSCKLTEKTTC